MTIKFWTYCSVSRVGQGFPLIPSPVNQGRLIVSQLQQPQLPNLNPSPDTSRDLIKSYSPRSKQSTFNFAHFLASTYVEGTKKKNTSYLLKA
jgi:hypothetical protein